VQAEDRQPACTTPDDRAFPLTTRIHGGPDSYTAGGGYGTWYLDLTNTTTSTCTGVHPVVVLVDDQRALKPSQPRLEFFEGDRVHPVRFESTDADELVGAFAGEDDRFQGFTVGPRRTLTVKVRLSVTSDAVPNHVTANAALVQRHADDGDWVGESNDYRFGIDAERAPDAQQPRKDAPEPRPEASSSGTPAGRLPFADELARTGTGVTALAAAAAVLLATAGTLLLKRRRR
jgi:LPXTG-motif cell wall-anchored protein